MSYIQYGSILIRTSSQPTHSMLGPPRGAAGEGIGSGGRESVHYGFTSMLDVRCWICIYVRELI